MERYQTIEAELQREVNQRAMAEQKLKEFEDELSSYLELDWSRGEPEMALVAVARDSGVPDEFVSRVQAQVAAERRARQEADDARAAIEHNSPVALGDKLEIITHRHPPNSTDQFGPELMDRTVTTLTYAVGDEVKAVAAVFAL